MRELVPKEDLPIKQKDGTWQVPGIIYDPETKTSIIGKIFITDYTLRHQRLYSQETNGRWTRPKSNDSVNSLDDS